MPFCSATVGSLALRRVMRLALPLARQYCHTHKHACTHTCVCTPISTLGRGETRTEWLSMGEKSWEERGTERASAREREREREREVSSHVQDQKVKRQISLLSPKEASPSERSVRRLRNRRNTLLLWWFKGDMTSRSSLKSQLVSDSVSQLWREFLLSGAWLCSVDCIQEDLQQKRGSRAGAGTKVSSSPRPPLWPVDPSRNFCWEALSREHGWIYDYVLRILDEHWRQVSLTFSWRYLTGKIRCDLSRGRMQKKD